MNQKFESIAEESMVHVPGQTGLHHRAFSLERFAELIVEECRQVVADLYRDTPLELCGPLLTADEKIAEHFYGVDK